MPRRHSRRTVRHRRHHRKQEGGGWSEVLSAKTMINPGNPVHQPYPGPGKDCAGTPTRPGTLTDIGSLRVPGGLPGVSSMAGVNTPPVVAGPASVINTQYGPSWLFKGGARKGKKQQRKKQQGGATQLGSGGNVTNVKTPTMTDMDDVLSSMKASNPAPIPIGPNPSGYPVFPERTVASNSAQGLSPVAGDGRLPKQSGGRYGFFPSDGPLNPVNGVGATGPAPFYRIPCERGTFDALNPAGSGPMAQDYTTLPFPKPIPVPPGLTPMRSSYMGGGRTRKRQQGGVYVGQVDAMRYYAPTAGYDNLPLMPQVRNNPGILMQVGYPARHMNMACLKTSGGGRKRTQRRRAPRKSRKQQQRKH